MLQALDAPRRMPSDHGDAEWYPAREAEMQIVVRRPA